TGCFSTLSAAIAIVAVTAWCALALALGPLEPGGGGYRRGGRSALHVAPRPAALRAAALRLGRRRIRHRVVVIEAVQRPQLESERGSAPGATAKPDLGHRRISR